MSESRRGMVYLVGAGPGDPGLITLRGIECLRKAEVVVYDRLIQRSLLSYAAGAELIDVGKLPDCHRVPQDEINALLVEKAGEGKVVVRLKGGDPFVFGRGGEEAVALAEAGLPFEVVPGVTSAIAAPAYAGIPVTHRDMACSTAFATGHRADFVDDPACDWAKLAYGPDTLVFLMGVRNLSPIVEQMVINGRSPDTPVALVECGTMAGQKTVVGTLADICQRAEEVHPPAVIIIGEVVRLRESLRWFDRPDRRPLLGLRVLNAQPSHRAGELSLRLAAAGAEPLELPTACVAPPTDYGPLDAAIGRLAGSGSGGPAYGWLVFADCDGVPFFFDRLFALGYDSRALSGPKLAAIGQATARELLRYGLVADFVSGDYDGLDIAAGAGDLLLLAQAEPTLPGGPAEALRGRGALVEAVSACAVHRLPADGPGLRALLSGGVDAAVFASPQDLWGLAVMLGDRQMVEALSPPTVACADPITAAFAGRLGVRVDVVAGECTPDRLVEALERCRSAQEQP